MSREASHPHAGLRARAAIHTIHEPQGCVELLLYDPVVFEDYREG